MRRSYLVKRISSFNASQVPLFLSCRRKFGLATSPYLDNGLMGHSRALFVLIIGKYHV